ncbi:mechanosensitive ion channel family protein [Hymenobacter taeanensis]|uniref:Mechanosensitive ion channel family protein n=1 Tax=Hymenobacter taeanensis TaxID=2735321 RepID=A0A6M6BF54_9BACT|nr:MULTISPECIES: mechanosensitive ion channel family protein [Hymenobacter]QJX46886.1 mechanosensitive ion channel family protein [Hymenobacter taeanensis]UOQ80759.1 mechanosensitive ion channel family protein [Hymenobacter sp. 5414T-23]
MNLQEFLNLRFLGNNVGAYLTCAGILLFGYVFKTLLSRLLSKLVFRFIRKRTEGVTEAQFQELLIRPVSIVVFFVTIYLAFQVLDYPVRSSELTRHEPWPKVALFRLYQVGLITGMAWIALRLVDFMVMVFQRRAETNASRLNNQLIPFAKDLLKVLVLTMAFLVLLSRVFGVNVTALIGGLGIGGLAVAFAAKESLENLIASFTIFLDRPFAVGDLVEVGAVTGTVEKVGFRSTRLRTAEKSYVTVPNKAMIDKPLNNLSLRTARRVSFTLALSHTTTSQQLHHIVKEGKRLLQEHPLVTAEVQMQFSALTPAAKEVTVQYFVETTSYDEYLQVKEELNYCLVEAVEHAGGTFASINNTVVQLSTGGRFDSLNSVTTPVL